MANWTFLTNHGAVLCLVAEHQKITAREIAAILDITERSVLRIIADLESEGYLERFREGRTNWYRVYHGQPLRREERSHVPVGDLLKALGAVPED
jgi:predicted transcriptional regulator of viral defense system